MLNHEFPPPPLWYNITSTYFTQFVKVWNQRTVAAPQHMKFHFHIHKIPPLVCKQSHTNPINILTLQFTLILFLLYFKMLSVFRNYITCNVMWISEWLSLRYYSDIYEKGRRKITKNLSISSRTSGLKFQFEISRIYCRNVNNWTSTLRATPLKLLLKLYLPPKGSPSRFFI